MYSLSPAMISFSTSSPSLLPQHAQDLSGLISPRQGSSDADEGFQRVKARKIVFIDSTWQQANVILRVRSTFEVCEASAVAIAASCHSNIGDPLHD